MPAFSEILSLDSCLEFPELKPEKLSVQGLEYTYFSISEDRSTAIYQADLDGCRLAIRLNSDGTAQIGSISKMIFPRNSEYVEFMPISFTAQDFIERYKEFLDMFYQQCATSKKILMGNLPDRQIVNLEQVASGLTDEEAALLETAYGLDGDYQKAAELLEGTIGNAEKIDSVLSSLLKKLASSGAPE